MQDLDKKMDHLKKVMTKQIASSVSELEDKMAIHFEKLENMIKRHFGGTA